MTTLIFLHGVGGSHLAWQQQLPYFAARGYRALAWDQPGYGGSPLVEPYDLEQIARALKRYVEEHAAGYAVLVGHSMGGFIAQETCARFPELVQGLVLCFTTPAFGGAGGEFQRKFVEARLAPLDAGASMGDIAARLMPAMRGSRSDPQGLALAEKLMAEVPPETYRKAVHLLTTFDRRALLDAIRVPTLVVAGSDDATAPAAIMERMAQKIAGAEFQQLEGCGHLGPMDQPDEFNAALAGFLARLGL